MKKGYLVGILLGVFLLSGVAFADTLTGSVGADWQSWTIGNLDKDGNPYWDKTTTDTRIDNTPYTNLNIGYFISNTGEFAPGAVPPQHPQNNTGPGVIPFWGIGGAFDSSFYFNKIDASQQTALKLVVTAYTGGKWGLDEIYWYDKTVAGAPPALQKIFSADQPIGTPATFTPTPTWGLAIKTGGGFDPGGSQWFYTESARNLNASDTNIQHFAVFSDNVGNPEKYWIGVEDLSMDFRDTRFNPPGLPDFDYNDLVFTLETVPVPVPEPATMLLLGSGLIGLAGFARRKFKKQ